MQQPRKAALLVDDEESIRYLLSKQLQELGYECVAAASGQEALKIASRTQFDLVLLDVMMPVVSGLDVLEQLRVGEKGQYPSIVMLTAAVDAVVAAKALSLGADAYVTKPCSMEYLRDRIRFAEERRGKIRRGEVVDPHEAAQLEGVVDLGGITADLIQQQVAAFEEATSSSAEPKPAPRRRFWPWGKRT